MNSENSTLTQTNSILLDGATGYIGSHLTYALTQNRPKKSDIRCLVRKSAKDSDINYLQTSGAKIFKANLDDSDLDTVFSQIDIACHLIGSIAPHKGETSASLHVGQTERFIQECLKGKVKKIVMVSTCGASPEAASEYHRTKWQAEKIVMESGIPSLIIRPSLVIGKIIGHRNSKLITRLEDLIRNKKFVPLIAGGSNKVQPVFIQDLIDAIIASFDLPDIFTGSIIEIGGPEILSIRDLVYRMMSKLNIKREVLALPIPLAKIIAGLSESIQEVPIISKDQIKISEQDNICHNNRLETLIKKNATTVDQALDSYHW